MRWVVLGLGLAACMRMPATPFLISDGFTVSAEGDSGQTVSGRVTGKKAQTGGLKVGAIHTLKTLAVADVTGGSFSLPLPGLAPAISEDVISKYDDARETLKEKLPMDPKYLKGQWPFLTFDGFWLTLFVDTNGNNLFDRGVDTEFRPQQTYYLVFQGFEGPPFTPFKKGWYLRFLPNGKSSLVRTQQLDQVILAIN